MSCCGSAIFVILVGPILMLPYNPFCGFVGFAVEMEK